MSISAIGLLLVITLSNYLKTFLQSSQQNLATVSFYILFIVLSTLVAISRVYISTHFPHQVFIALAVGILITTVIRRISASSDASKGPQCLQISTFMLIFGLGLYKTIVALGYNPSSTVIKATKWCRKKDWVHLDTTLFYALIRDVGAMSGLGISLLMKQRKTMKMDTAGTLTRKVVHVLVGLLLMQVLERLKLPQGNVLLFYCLAFFKFMIVPIIVVVFLPFLLVNIFNKNSLGNVKKSS